MRLKCSGWLADSASFSSLYSQLWCCSRAEFRVWHEGADAYYIMFQKVQPARLKDAALHAHARLKMSHMRCPAACAQPAGGSGNEKQQRPERVRVDRFPVGSMLLNELMERLIEEVRQQPLLKTKLYQVHSSFPLLVLHTPHTCWSTSAIACHVECKLFGHACPCR